MSDAVSLESIRDCFRASHPAPLATCAADGTPHISYVSQVQYLDSERVATSRQWFNHGLAAMSVSPFAQTLIVCPGSGEQFRLDLRYLHTATDGEAFDAMRANLDAIASQMGLGPAFRLRGVDVHRVLRCTRVSRQVGDPAASISDPLAPVNQFARRLEPCAGYQETAQEALDAFDDIFGSPYTILFTLDASTGRLVATAGSGAARTVVGVGVEIGVGFVGMAARRRRPIVTSNLVRSRAMASLRALMVTSETRSVPRDCPRRGTQPPSRSSSARNYSASSIWKAPSRARSAARQKGCCISSARTRPPPWQRVGPWLPNKHQARRPSRHRAVAHHSHSSITKPMTRSCATRSTSSKALQDASCGRCSPRMRNPDAPGSQTASCAWTSRSACQPATTTSRRACSCCAGDSQTSTAESRSNAWGAGAWNSNSSDQPS